jgi:hypothetical protein
LKFPYSRRVGENVRNLQTSEVIWAHSGPGTGEPEVDEKTIRNCVGRSPVMFFAPGEVIVEGYRHELNWGQAQECDQRHPEREDKSWKLHKSSSVGGFES